MAKRDFIDLRVKGLIKEVSVSVANTQTVGSSAADVELQGGFIIGYHPASNQDQHIDNMVLNADGSVTITLAAAATATNYFTVIVIR